MLYYLQVYNGNKIFKFTKEKFKNSEREFCIFDFNLGISYLSLVLIKKSFKKSFLKKAKKIFPFISNKLRSNINIIESKTFEEFNNLNKSDVVILFCYNKIGDRIGSLDSLIWMVKDNFIPDEEYKYLAYNKKGYMEHFNDKKTFYKV